MGIRGTQPHLRSRRDAWPPRRVNWRASNRISITRVILPPDVVRQTLERLPLREATMVLVDAVTALRASELVALKWRMSVGTQASFDPILLS
jgi:integrase